jgi:TonB family protein
LLILALLLEAAITQPVALVEKHAVMRAGTISDSFYSNDARKAKIEGRATVGFTVDASGMPVDCRTLISSRSELLDAQTCKMTETFRSKPAVDLSGRPVPQKFVFSIAWTMPKNLQVFGPAPAPVQGETSAP